MQGFELTLRLQKLRILHAFGHVDEIRCYSNLIHEGGVLVWQVDREKHVQDPNVSPRIDEYPLEGLQAQGWSKLLLPKDVTMPMLVFALYYKEPWKNGHDLMRQSVVGFHPIHPQLVNATPYLHTAGKVYYYVRNLTGDDPNKHPEPYDTACQLSFTCEYKNIAQTFVGMKAVTNAEDSPTWTHQRCLGDWTAGFEQFIKAGYSYDQEMIKRMNWATVYLGTRLLGPVATTHLADIPEQKVDPSFLLSMLIISLICNLGIAPLTNLDLLVDALQKREGESNLWLNILYTALSFFSNSLPYVRDLRLGPDGVDLCVEAVTHALEVFAGDCEDLEWLVCAIYYAAKTRGDSQTGQCFVTLNGSKCSMSADKILYLLTGLKKRLAKTEFGLLLSVVGGREAHASGLMRHSDSKVCHIVDGIEPLLVPMSKEHAERNKALNQQFVPALEQKSAEDVRFLMSMYHVKNLVSDLHPVRFFKIPRGTEICLNPKTKTIGSSFETIDQCEWVAPANEASIPLGDYKLKYPLVPLDEQMAKLDVKIYEGSTWQGTQPDTRFHFPYGQDNTITAYLKDANKKAVFRVTGSHFNVLLALLWQ